MKRCQQIKACGSFLKKKKVIIKNKNPGAAWKYWILQQRDAEQQGLASSAGPAGSRAWTQSLGLGDVGGEEEVRHLPERSEHKILTLRSSHWKAFKAAGAPAASVQQESKRRFVVCSSGRNSLARHFLILEFGQGMMCWSYSKVSRQMS